MSLEAEALLVASDAARRAGGMLRAGLNEEEKHERAKSHRHDPVTVFDGRSEEIIVDAIERAFPDHGIISEEGTGINGESPYRWIIDPLDGTNNFLRGIPHFAVSIALLHGDEYRMGCIYDPMRDELFTATAGGGAKLNGRKIRVSRQADMDGAMVGVGFSSRPQRALYMQSLLPRVIPHARGLRTSGFACLDLAYVAAGRLDVAWYLSLWPWDVAAGILLVTEAGGRVSDLVGDELHDPQEGIVATNGAIHAAAIALTSR